MVHAPSAETRSSALTAPLPVQHAPLVTAATAPLAPDLVCVLWGSGVISVTRTVLPSTAPTFAMGTAPAPATGAARVTPTALQVSGPDRLVPCVMAYISLTIAVSGAQ